MTRELRRFAVVTGLVCLLLGAAEFVLGGQAVPGGGDVGASGESSHRFAGGILMGFGLAWLWAARTNPLPVPVLRGLAGVLLLGAAGRLVSLVADGRPHWFSLVQLGVEAVVPVVVLTLAARVGRRPSDG